jgi:phosphohistidine phosphatase
MKTLILVRHGKAEKREGAEGDIARPLVTSGKNDALKIAGFLKNESYFPNIILSSNAVRARETAEIMAEVLCTGTGKLRVENRLYYSTARTILNFICEAGGDCDIILLVAHNPGISDLVRGLSSGRELFMETSQAAIFRYKIDHWHQLGDKEADVFKSVRPDSLADNQ